MNAKGMFTPADVREVVENGVAKGFIVDVRIPYYRGVALSLIDDITVKYDNEVYPADQLTFTTRDGTFTMAEMATMSTLRWEFGEKAQIFVPRLGGFYMASHRVEVTIAIRISYMGGARPSSHAEVVSLSGD